MNVKLFDIAFLHDSYETLEGCTDSGIKGFFDDSISGITELVEKGPGYRKTLLKQQASYTSYVTEECGTAGHSEYIYFYYDPNYDAKYAFLIEHKPIQLYDFNISDWVDYPGDYDNPPADWEEYEWRIKPDISKVKQLTFKGKSIIQQAIAKRMLQIMDAIMNDDFNELQSSMLCSMMTDEDFFRCFEE